MRARYYGKKVVRNEFGDVVRTFCPQVEVSFKSWEKDKALERLRLMEKADFDLFACECDYVAVIPVCNREDGESVLEMWKEAGKMIKEGK